MPIQLEHFFTSIEETSQFLTKNEQQKTWSDLRLDLQMQDDIQLSYDEEAIRNSLRNLFTTQKGQRILFPDYGMSFYDILFEPVSEIHALAIQLRLQEEIPKCEPRVSVVQCKVEPLPDENRYNVYLQLSFLPDLRKLTTTSLFEFRFALETPTQSIFFFDQSPQSQLLFQKPWNP